MQTGIRGGDRGDRADDWSQRRRVVGGRVRRTRHPGRRGARMLLL